MRDTLCVWCVAAMATYAAVRVESRAADGSDPDVLSYRYRRTELVDAARAAVTDGKVVTIDNMSHVGIYAQTMYHGSAICLAHVPYAVEQWREQLPPDVRSRVLW